MRIAGDAPTGLASWNGGEVGAPRDGGACLTLDGRLALSLARVRHLHSGSLEFRDMQEVCVVVPCFNEEHRLRGADFLSFIASHPDASLCFVDDGSRDGTVAVLEAAAIAAVPDRILVHRLPANGGKAEAVRAGVLHVAATGDGRSSATGTPTCRRRSTRSIGCSRRSRRTPGCQLVLGSRVKRLGAHIERRDVAAHHRDAFSRPAPARFSDSRSTTRSAARSCFAPRWPRVFFAIRFSPGGCSTSKCWCVCATTSDVGHRHDAEVPLGRWEEVGGSKLGLSDMINVPLELLKIRAHYNGADSTKSNHESRSARVTELLGSSPCLPSMSPWRSFGYAG